jgi:hypothetical protein
MNPPIRKVQVKKLLAVAAAGEVATGLVLLVYPPIVVRLLFGVEIAGAGTVVSRIAGISLIALGLSCWPSSDPVGALRGMLSYNLLATLYLGYLAIGGEWVGWLLWPAVAVHAVATIIFARAWFVAPKRFVNPA